MAKKISADVDALVTMLSSLPSSSFDGAGMMVAAGWATTVVGITISGWCADKDDWDDEEGPGRRKLWVDVTTTRWVSISGSVPCTVVDGSRVE